MSESEDHFRQLAEALPQLIWTCRADGPCDYLSPQWVKYTGIPESEQLGMGWLNQLHPEDRERTIAVWNAAVGVGSFFDIEFRIRRSDGIYRWFSARAIPLRNNEGRVTKWFGSNTDIEDHKHLEEALQLAHNELEQHVAERTEALRESENKYRQFIETLQEGIWVIDQDAKTTFVNPHMAEMLGYSVEEMLGKPLFYFMDEGGVEIAKRNVERRKQGIAEELNFKFVRKDGNRIYTRLTTAPLTDETGNYVGALAGVIDITAQKRTTEALRESEAKLKTLFEILPVGISILDAERKILYANPALEMILDVSREKLLKGNYRGRKCLRSDGTPMPAEEYASMRVVKERRAVHNVETGVVKEDGNVIWANVSAVPVAFPDWKVVIVAADITERRKAEKTILDLSKFPSENPSPVLRIAKGGEILYSNKPGLELLANWNVKIGGKAPEKWRGLIKDALESAKPGLQEEEEEVKGKIFSVTISPVIESGYANLYARDITERKRTEEELKIREGLLQKIFDTIPVGLWFANKDGKLLRGNPAGVKIWGAEPKVSPSEYGVFKARRLPSGEEIAPDTWALAHTIREGVTIVDELLEIETFDGKKKTILNYTAPLLDDKGNVQGAIVVNQDITERKRAEDRIRMFSRELLAAHEDEKKRVSTTLHHDVGSLAVGMSAYLDTMEEDILSGKAGEALKSAKTARKLFKQSVARLKEVAVELRPPDLDILGLRAAMRQHFSRITERVGIRIHFTETLGRRRLPDDIATILFRIAQESLTNAITHGQAKKVDVCLSASQKTVKLTIRDNGKGFDPSEQRAQKALSMGLYIMQDMATSLGGIFEIDSRRGKGTTVRVSLPLKTAPVGPGNVTVRDNKIAQGKTSRSAGRGSRSKKGIHA